jgi:hypothetical protein
VNAGLKQCMQTVTHSVAVALGCATSSCPKITTAGVLHTSSGSQQVATHQHSALEQIAASL